MTTPVQIESIQVTPNAVRMVKDLISQNKLDDQYALRIFVTGKSCSGYQYGMALDNKAQATDSIFDREGIRLLVDDISMQYMQGSTIDYIEDERGSGFMVDNPNAVSTCSCGGGGCECENGQN